MHFKRFSENMMWGFTTLLFFLFTALRIPYGGLVLAVMLILIMLFYAGANGLVIRISITYYHIYMLIFACFIAVSSLWAIVPKYALRRFVPLIETALAMLVVYSCYHDESGVNKILKALMWRGYLVLAYIVARYGVNNIMYMLRNEIRVDNEVINANTIGIVAAYSIIINAYYVTKNKKISLLDSLVVPAFLIIAFSGSRKALVLVAGGIFALLIFRNWNKKDMLKSGLKIVVVVFLLLIAGFFVLQLPFMEGILNRMSDLFLLLSGQGRKGVSGYIRLEYTKLGFRLFREHPIFGIGIDNARIYAIQISGLDHHLHNNYAEMMADGGIIGVILYYWIYLYLFHCFRKYKEFRNSEYDICLILLVCALVMEAGMLTYESYETYYMLLLFCLEVEKLKKEYQQNKTFPKYRQERMTDYA